jgi:hypothetical protein
MLSVPPGALLAPTSISAHTLAADTIAVQLQPEGLSFAVPATLMLSYAACVPQPTVPVQIIAVDDQMNSVLGTVPSMNSAPASVSGPISQLGDYAIGLK